jgi:hypothetical protein
MTEPEQLDLFAPEATPISSAPRCPMCERPRRRLRGTHDYARYCAGSTCANPTRLCQSCGKSFTVGVNGAGTKYCSADCKRIGYTVRPEGTLPLCAWCGTTAPHPARGGRVWPYICNRCTESIRHLLTRLKDHHVPHERARRLLTDPGCEICGIDIVAKRRDPTTQKVRALLVVDHDHDCCPGLTSCGQCVRGLICTLCNSALGMARNDPAILTAMITYLGVYGPEEDT